MEGEKLHLDVTFLQNDCDTAETQLDFSCKN